MVNAAVKLVDKLHTYDERNAKRDVEKSRQVWAKGLAEERRIIAFLIHELGFRVTTSSEYENKVEDIDCWVGEIPVSIKTQHSSLNYAGKTVCFELEQKRTGLDAWDKSWYYNGKAEKYLVLQGETLSLIDKQALVEQVDKQGFSYTRTNKASTRAYSGGSAYYEDARCGYIPQAELPIEKQWTLPLDWVKG